MLLVNSSQYYNLMVLIVVSHLYGVDYLPFNQPSTEFEKKIQNKMKFGIECLQENAKERQYS